MSRARASGAVGLALLVAGGAARAQSTPPSLHPSPPAPLTSTLTGSAKVDYDTARDMLARHDFEGALVRFTRVYGQVHDARLLADVALCEKSLSHCDRAVRLFDEALSTGAALFSPSQTADIRAMVQACSPPGGGLRAAGAANPVVPPVAPARAAGAANPVVPPVAPARGAAGVPRVGAQGAQGLRVSDEKKATADVSDRGVSVGALAVRAGPNDTIALDGRVVGVHRWEGRVAPGHHSIAVAAQGMRTYRADIEVAEDQTRTLDVTLAEPRGAPVWMWATGGGLVVTGVIVAIVSVFRPADPIAPAPASASALQSGLRRR